MEKDLVLDTTLFGSKGVIGRRDFFLNILYISMISSPLWLPAMIFLVFPKALDMDSLTTIALCLIVVSIIALLGMSLPNIIKRLNDINGQLDRRFNMIYSLSLFALVLLAMFVNSFFFVLVFGVAIYLFCKKGKITSKLPRDELKEFNWGAYFGTWLWGLFNKSYKTLWIIPLSLTPLGAIFQLICGFKGNEWAANNKDWKSLEQFKESQSTQTIVFTILSLVVMPIVITIIIIALVFVLAFKTVEQDAVNPEKAKSRIEKFENALVSFGNLYFESYEITSEENNFYILPNTWRYASFKERTDMLEFAANLAATERRKKNTTGKYVSYRKSTELPRTKIYNAKNGELLAEFNLDESVFESEKIRFKDVMKAAFKAYRFYEPTSD